MDKATRIYKLHRLLANRRVGVTLERIMEELECSRATASRFIREMRQEFMAPLTFDEGRGGYLLHNPDGEAIQLPGIWFSEQELLALLTMERMLAQMGSRYLTRLLAPLRERVNQMLGGSMHESSSIGQRICVMEPLQRRTRSGLFEQVAAATLQGQRLSILYHGRQRNEPTRREISPQRLTRYRGNWYLDAWCHQRTALRRFSLDRVSELQVLKRDTKQFDLGEVAQQMDAVYGAFAGPAQHQAVLRFRPDEARWASDETWHTEQSCHWLPDGRYELTFPFGEMRELLMDIQRYGPGVEVVGPPALRDALQQSIQENLQQYLAAAE